MKDTYEWRYFGRAYCHQHDGYYLRLYERVIYSHLEEENKTISISDDGKRYLVWGDVLKYEVKQVSDRTGKTEFLKQRDWYWVLPSSNYLEVE